MSPGAWAAGLRLDQRFGLADRAAGYKTINSN